MYFEEMEEGLEVVSPGRTVTETDVVLFAGLSGDYNQLHTDAEFARGTIFGQRIAHGLLGLSIASGLAGRPGFIEGTAIAFMGLDWKFKAPVFIGDTISLTARVARRREVRRLGGGIVVFQVALKNQRDETVQEGEWTILIRSRAAGQTT
ncbi:MAG: MaoC family dehydratase N-terminal domain-containing protein [Anaerolineae bacterium]|nr:MaoC family dehydratase N-terminal domain-containing protein [Anaerolineae bacterium]